MLPVRIPRPSLMAALPCEGTLLGEPTALLSLGMPLFAGVRTRRVVRRAEEAYARAGLAAAGAILDAAAALAAAGWANLAVAIYNQGHLVDAERAIRRALQLEPGRGDALIFLAELLAETEREDEAIDTYRELLRRYPQAAREALALGKLLAEREDFPEVKALLAPFIGHSQELQVLLAQAHYGLGEFQEVVTLLDPTVRRMLNELKNGLNLATSHRELYEEYTEIRRLHDEAYAALHGREKVIESELVKRDLDPRAGVNYKLLGEARMARHTGGPLAESDLRLRSVEGGLAFGQGLISRGERARGLCHLGLARLRQGRFEQARQHFSEARDEDDDSFAAYLGLGAALDLDRGRVLERLAALPDLPMPALLDQVVIDWPALTPQERKVVTVAAEPAAAVLPRIVAAGAVARLLPIDVRLADLPGMREPDEERFEDHRCIEGLTGAATAELAASKIEELLELTGERDSVFAHELAHLVHFHLPQDQQDEIDALYQKALGHEHVATDYQTTNSAEFFAVAYTDFLAHEHRLPWRRELDDEGVLEDTFDLIRRLGR
jgi:tetratricopeptide (TPR) repeat protein